MAKLQVLICTLGAEGIRRVAESFHPQVEGVEYLVSWQMPKGELPSKLERSDFKVYASDSKGLAHNRNLSLRYADAPYCLISDDDVSYKSEELNDLMRLFEENPNIELFTFTYSSEDRRKVYPDKSFDLRCPPKGYFVTSFEIAFRLKSIKGKVSFNENFGIGAKVFNSGEEDLFIYEVLSAGIEARFFPIIVGTHYGPTTCDRAGESQAFWMTKGAVMSYVHKKTWFVRIVVNAWRASRKSDKGFVYFFTNAIKGVKYASKHNVFG